MTRTLEQATLLINYLLPGMQVLIGGHELLQLRGWLVNLNNKNCFEIVFTWFVQQKVKIFVRFFNHSKDFEWVSNVLINRWDISSRIRPFKVNDNKVTNKWRHKYFKTVNDPSVPGFTLFVLESISQSSKTQHVVKYRKIDIDCF